ncbi:MAG: hypothetical protein ACRDLN_02490 [Solirubrobacteraceae bacterium]
MHTIDRGIVGDPGAEVVANDLDGRTVARAAYTRVYGPRAVITLDVDDPFWHRGLPETLLADLCLRAARAGISTFLARARASDVRLLAMLRREFSARESRDGQYVDIELSTVRPPPSGKLPSPTGGLHR